MKKKICNLLLGVFSLAFCISSVLAVGQLARQHKEEKAFTLLAQEVKAAEESLAAEQWEQQENCTEENTGNKDEKAQEKESVAEEREMVEEEQPVPAPSTVNKTEEISWQRLLPVDKAADGTDTETGILRKYLSVSQKNRDFFGWLEIADTRIDYPVMYTPEEQEYYLRRAFDGSASSSGSLFLDTRYSEKGRMYIVYGHKMRNQSMFGTLTSYEKEKYWKKHPLISFDTLYEEGEYEVVAAFYSRIYGEGEEGFRYYEYGDLSEEERFAEFKSGIEGAALYDTGVTLNYGDTVLMLSTCSYHTDDGRFVVVARKR